MMTEDKLLEKLPEDACIIRLPKLGELMEEGTIVGCLVKVGDEVKKGDNIFEIETDKATVEIQSPFSGTVKAILTQMYDTVSVNSPLMIIAEADVEIADDLIEKLKNDSKIPKSTHSAPVIEEAYLDVDAADIVSASLEQTEKQYTLGETFTPTRMQKLTAQRMLKSKREIPCFYLNAKVDVTELVDYRKILNESRQLKVSYNDFVIKAAAFGLKRFELMTGQPDGDNIRLADSIGVGLAIDTPGGLVAPVIKDADTKDICQITQDSQKIIEKAKSNKLTPEDLQGACITVSNLGAFGVDSFIPIVIPGQCSILGVGQITDTLLPEPKEPQIRKTMRLWLSVDHRVVNGAYAGQFLDFVRKILEDKANFS